ncbi:hypothetical protein RUND412_004757 [Rhizina undulata]
MSARAPPKPDPPKTKKHDPLLERIYEGEAPDTTDTKLRWAAYANRIKTIMNAGHRYIAYSSDIGESFRPVAHPNWIRAAYGISWLYLAGDVANEGYKAYVSNQAVLHGGHSIASVPEWLRTGNSSTTPRHQTPLSEESKTPSQTKKISAIRDAKNLDADFYYEDIKLKPTGSLPFLEDWRTVIVQRAIFQGLASMGLPALTIHSVVRYSGRAMRNVKNPLIRTWGPVGLGLAVVPALPYIFDEPVEEAVDWTFEKGYELVTGKLGISEKRAQARAHGEKAL